eukprot:scaffold123179_cov75-Phaeocystis_antarctica.AAC.3
MNESAIHLYTTHDPIGNYAGVWQARYSRQIRPVARCCTPLQNYRNSPILRPLREDRGRGRELDVRSKSGIAPSSSG